MKKEQTRRTRITARQIWSLSLCSGLMSLPSIIRVFLGGGARSLSDSWECLAVGFCVAIAAGVGSCVLARKNPKAGFSGKRSAALFALGVGYYALILATCWAEATPVLGWTFLVCAALLGLVLTAFSFRALNRDDSPPDWEAQAEELLQRQAEEKQSADVKKAETGK